MKNIKDMEEKEVAQLCIKLWKKISRMSILQLSFARTMSTGGDVLTNLKKKILKEMGYDNVLYGCPFCEYYFSNLKTPECPLAVEGLYSCGIGCHNFSYSSIIEAMYTERYELVRKYARKFVLEIEEAIKDKV